MRDVAGQGLAEPLIVEVAGGVVSKVTLTFKRDVLSQPPTVWLA